MLTEFVKRRYTDLPDVDLIAEVAGAALAAALVTAVERWGRDGCTTDLSEVVTTSVDLVRTGLAPLA